MSIAQREKRAQIAQTIKLKKAALLQLTDGLTPGDALYAVDLPADVKGSSLWATKLGKMRKHLAKHVNDWVDDAWGGRSSPPVSTASSHPTSPTPGCAVAAAMDTPKMFLPIPGKDDEEGTYEDSLLKCIADLEVQMKKSSRAAQARVSRRDKNIEQATALIATAKAQLAAERKEHAHTREEAHHFNNEAEDAKERLEQWIVDNAENSEVQSCNELCSELQTWEDGRYSTPVRFIYMQLMRDGVSPNIIRHTVRTILTLAGIKAGCLQGRTTAQLMKAEMAVLADQDAGATLAEQPDGSVALAGDEATKLGKSRFALGMFFADSIGDPIVFAALGVLDAMGGTALKTKEAILDLLDRIAQNHTLMKK